MYAPAANGADGKELYMEENIAIENQALNEASPAQNFDVLLQNREFRSEFDRRISRALETARGKWAQETERKIERACAEAERLARMSGEERMALDFAQREAALRDREQQIMRRELRAEAARMLSERSLPLELMDALNYESAEQVNLSMDAAEKAFKQAVQTGVEERMRAAAPSIARSGRSGDMSDDEYYRSRVRM